MAEKVKLGLGFFKWEMSRNRNDEKGLESEGNYEKYPPRTGIDGRRDMSYIRLKFWGVRRFFGFSCEVSNLLPRGIW